MRYKDKKFIYEIQSYDKIKNQNYDISWDKIRIMRC